MNYINSYVCTLSHLVDPCWSHAAGAPPAPVCSSWFSPGPPSWRRTWQGFHRPLTPAGSLFPTAHRHRRMKGDRVRMMKEINQTFIQMQIYLQISSAQYQYWFPQTCQIRSHKKPYDKRLCILTSSFHHLDVADTWFTCFHSNCRDRKDHFLNAFFMCVGHIHRLSQHTFLLNNYLN